MIFKNPWNIIKKEFHYNRSFNINLSDMKTEEFIKQTFTENISTIKFSGGVFGRTTHQLLGFFTCFAPINVILIFKNFNQWIIFLVFFIEISLIWYINKKNFSFAEKHPFLAILEGAEIVKMEQIKEQSMGSNPINRLSEKIEEETPIIDNQSSALIPDRSKIKGNLS